MEEISGEEVFESDGCGKEVGHGSLEPVGQHQEITDESNSENECTEWL